MWGTVEGREETHHDRVPEEDWRSRRCPLKIPRRDRGLEGVGYGIGPWGSALGWGRRRGSVRLGMPLDGGACQRREWG